MLVAGPEGPQAGARCWASVAAELYASSNRTSRNRNPETWKHSSENRKRRWISGSTNDIRVLWKQKRSKNVFLNKYFVSFVIWGSSRSPHLPFSSACPSSYSSARLFIPDLFQISWRVDGNPITKSFEEMRAIHYIQYHREKRQVNQPESSKVADMTTQKFRFLKLSGENLTRETISVVRPWWGWGVVQSQAPNILPSNHHALVMRHYRFYSNLHRDFGTLLWFCNSSFVLSIIQMTGSVSYSSACYMTRSFRCTPRPKKKRKNTTKNLKHNLNGELEDLRRWLKDKTQKVYIRTD